MFRLLLLIALALGAGIAVFSLRDDDVPPQRPSRAAAVAPRLTGTAADIPALQRALRADPDRADLRASLAEAYLQRVRETGDPSFYARAEGVLGTPRTTDGLATAGELALARHDFKGALALGRSAGTVGAPIRVDALVELGRYGEAERELQRTIDRKPNLSAYARVSYLRELYGDLPGAAAAMRLAVTAGGPAVENVAYVSALLGELERRRGRTAAARGAFRGALAAVPGFAAAEAGLARLDAERRGLGAAIARLRRVVERLPLPEYVVALGEAELAAGRTTAGRRDLALVAAEQRLQRAAGVDVDVELAVFEADHGSPERALALARRAWQAAPSVRSADALGWALTRAGNPEEGLRWARRALRLGTLDPLWRAHAGLSALAAGKRAEGRRQLRIALRRGLDGYPWQARRVRRALR
jgi:tetratricopeptide (TPR) repeat protein